MKYTLGAETQTFKKARKNIEKKYHGAKKYIDKEINNSLRKTNYGDKIPGFYGHVIKIRVPLKNQNIGRSKGLRLIILKKQGVIIPLLVYSKTGYPGEKWVLKNIKKTLEELAKTTKS